MREGWLVGTRLDSPIARMASVGGLIQGEAKLGPVPEGYCWYVEGIAYVTGGSGRPAVVLAAVTPDDTNLGGPGGLLAWDGAGLVQAIAIPIALNMAGNSAPGVYVGPGHVLHLNASNLGGGGLLVGDQVSITCQIAVHQLDPDFIMSPEDRRQVLAAHERRGAELTHVATAERRAV